MDDSIIPSTIADLVADFRSRDQATTERVMAQFEVLGAPAIPWLLAALKLERDTQVRINLGKALARLGIMAWEPLLAAARDSADALMGIDEPQAFEPLMVATRDPDTAVRRHAFQAVAALLPALAPERQLEACDGLLSALLEPDPYAQQAAVRGLSTLGAHAVGPLVGLVQDRRWDVEHPATRSYAIRALAGLLTTEPPIPELSQQLFTLLDSTLHEQENPSEVRSEAAMALGKTRDPRALDALIRALTVQSPEVRAAAAAALRDLGDSRAVPMLKDALTWARAEVSEQNAHEVLQWLLDELEVSIAALSATSRIGEA